MKRITLVGIFVLASVLYLSAQETLSSTYSRQILFKTSYTLIDSTFSNNAASLNALLVEIGQILVNPNQGISRITVVSGSSPDGRLEKNIMISDERNASVRNAITNRYPETASLIAPISKGVDWEGTIDAVENNDVPYKDEVLKVLRDKPVSTVKGNRTIYPRHDALRDLRGGEPYRWLLENVFPGLRKTEVTVFYWEEIPTPEPEPESIQEENVPAEEPVVQEPVVPEITTLPQPCFALKTNLLYDAAVTPNFAIEIPINNKWSVGAGYTFPWWVWQKNSRAWEILYWDLYARRWLGDRNNRDWLSGWFVGLEAGGGYYDIEPFQKGNPNSGYQGWGLAATLEGGYSFYLNDRWNLELNIGAGYMHTNYALYKGVMEDQHLVWQHDDKYNWFGPTKVGVSLVYKIYHNKGYEKRRTMKSDMETEGGQ